MQSAQSPPPLPRSPPPVSTSPVSARMKSPELKSPESRSPKSYSPEPRQRKSITSINSNGSSGERMVPLPEIQITRTESNRSTVDEKWVKPKELEEDKSKKLD